MLLEWKNVTGQDKDFSLREVSFELEEGYICGLAGKNGAGKTTLLKYMLDERKRYQGDILLEGDKIHEDHAKTMQKIGYIADERQFFNHHTAEENARIFSTLYDNWEKDIFLSVMEELNVSPAQELGGMSRGERLKFQLAFTMAYHPRLYLFDEVTGGMDPVFRKEFFRILHRLLEKEAASVILVTHIEEELEEKVDYRGIMEDGRLVSFGETQLV